MIAVGHSLSSDTLGPYVTNAVGYTPKYCKVASFRDAILFMIMRKKIEELPEFIPINALRITTVISPPQTPLRQLPRTAPRSALPRATDSEFYLHSFACKYSKA